MYPVDLSGKKGIVLGVANDHSIAWAIAGILSQAGARLALTYQGDRLRERVTRLASTLDGALVLACDATDDQQIADVFEQVGNAFGDISFLVHSIAFANREDLSRPYSETGREGFRIALEVSAYSLLPLVRHSAKLMPQGGSVVTMTFQASQRVFPGYKRHGHGQSSAGTRGATAGGRVRGPEHPGQRHFSRTR